METNRSNMYRDVKDIDANGREWLEQFLGRQLNDDEQVFIMAYTPNVVPDERTRKAAFREIQSVLKQAHENAAAQGVTPEEADAAVEEAMDYVRHRKK